jgi:hypothetical protein
MRREKARLCFSTLNAHRDEMFHQPEGPLRVKSGHVQRTRSCPLWANSGHQAFSSKVKMRFQSFFMLITGQPFFFASS